MPTMRYREAENGTFPPYLSGEHHPQHALAPMDQRQSGARGRLTLRWSSRPAL